MEQLTDLKAILHSKRANIYYLEKCRVMQKDGRVLYLTEAKNQNQYWNIPIANTTCLLLGTGTSVTQAAMRMLAQAGVLVGFCGGGATPLLMANEIEWLSPQSEYRPTEYVQGWMQFWFDDAKRLKVAKEFQAARIGFLQTVWGKDRDLKQEGFNLQDDNLNNAIQGELGGNGIINSRALSVASLSTPAKTVTKWSGRFAFCKLCLAPGRALAAAQPQTEFTTTKVVPSFAMADSTASTVCNSSKPTFVRSSRIGFTNSAGYIFLILRIINLKYKDTKCVTISVSNLLTNSIFGHN